MMHPMNGKFNLSKNNKTKYEKLQKTLTMPINALIEIKCTATGEEINK